MRNFGLKLANVLFCRKLDLAAPPLTLDLPQSSFLALSRSWDLLRSPPPAPQSPSLTRLGPYGRSDLSRRPLPPLLGSVQPLKVARAGGRDGAPLGRTRKVSGSQARVVCFRTLHPITTTTSSPYRSVWLALRSTPTAWGAPRCPQVPDAAPLPTGLPSRGGGPRCCVHGVALWPGEQEPAGPPGLRS